MTFKKPQENNRKKDSSQIIANNEFPLNNWQKSVFYIQLKKI